MNLYKTKQTLTTFTFIALVFMLPQQATAKTPNPAQKTSIKKIITAKGASWSYLKMAKMAVSSKLRFPMSKGVDLREKSRLLPKSLPGKVTVALVGFARTHREVFQKWMPAIQSLQKKHKGLDYAWIPVFGSLPGFIGYFIKRGMKKVLKTRLKRQRVILMFIKQKIYTQALHLPNTKKVAVILTDSSGRIFKKIMGLPSKRNIMALKKAIEQMKN